MQRSILLLLMLLCPALVWAGDFLCTDGTSTLTAYLYGRDQGNTSLSSCPTGSTVITAISRPNTHTAQTFMTTTPSTPAGITHWPDYRMITVIGGLPVAKNNGAIQAILDADTAAAALAATLAGQATANDVCAATFASTAALMATRKATLQAQIDGLSGAANLAKIQDTMTIINNELYHATTGIIPRLVGCLKLLQGKP